MRKLFKEYYWRNKVRAPQRVEQREFGVGTLEDKIRFRHKSFPSEKDLRVYLEREAPYFISYSTAYYSFPENQPMNTKEWLGADLIFDLDVPLTYLSSEPLETVRVEAVNLVEFLESDFGFQGKDISVNFSGHKGYHIHVSSDCVRELSGDERREIVDYITWSTSLGEYLRVEVNEVFGPRKGDSGWAGRIYRGTYDFIKNSSVEELQEIKGIGAKKAELIHCHRSQILGALESGRYDLMPDIVSIEKYGVRTGDPNVKDYAIKSVRSPLLEKIIRSQSIKITDADKMVTIDTSRLIRLPDTIHGGSGLLAKRVKKLDEFDPLVDAVAFGKKTDEIEVKVLRDVPKFELNGETHGPFKKDSTTKVPEYAGIYLMLKDSAEKT